MAMTGIEARTHPNGERMTSQALPQPPRAKRFGAVADWYSTPPTAELRVEPVEHRQWEVAPTAW